MDRGNAALSSGLAAQFKLQRMQKARDWYQRQRNEKTEGRAKKAFLQNEKLHQASRVKETQRDDSVSNLSDISPRFKFFWTIIDMYLFFSQILKTT